MDSNITVDSNGRVRGVTVVKPIVVGNVAQSFGKKREEDGHTHQWTLYVKPYKNEIMSQYVKKVQFKLHDSYANNTRICVAPPYEVTETGWGEFEATIKIYFHDPNERPVTLYHILKLFQHNDPLIATGRKRLIFENYDELVFQDPSAMMYHCLLNPRPLTQSEYKHETDFDAKKALTLEKILNAKEQTRNEISELKDCLVEAKDLIQALQEEIAKAQTAKDQPDASTS